MKKQLLPILLCITLLVLAFVELVHAANGSLTNEDDTIYTVTIEYVYASDSKFAGQRVALPYIAEVADGDTLSETITSPNCVGYAPNKEKIDLSSLGKITANHALRVEYSPAEVSYTVRHYQQNVDDDEYTWVDTTMETGRTESETSDTAAKTYTGFTALPHYHEEIAADSSTMIDIYYDRNYYLMSFDLHGGHGVEAIYARYGEDISVSAPQRAGYSFRFWSLDGATKVALPDTMPASNQSYDALWTPENTTYTVAYWLENPNVEGSYDFVESVSKVAQSGSEIDGDDNAEVDGVSGIAVDKKYYSFNAEKTDKDIVVAGDGSTVVNVYYDRNEYTLKFYYARKEGNTYDIANNTNNSSADGGTAASASWVGDFASKPTLDSKYTEQTETINGNTYYYFTLTAKYGASLSELWPNAPLSGSDNYDFISWGTHYGSGYYADNSNKNIKGVYSIMDSGLLIDPTVTADKGVNHWMVGYWNTAPTMYTYEIYYTLLSGETADRTYNGIEYKKVTEYTVGSTDLPSGQTSLSFEGVVSVGKDYDANAKVDGQVIRFYYQRNENDVTLDDSYGNTKKYEDIPYGDVLSAYLTGDLEPEYPAELPVGAYEFGGWYQSKEGIGALDTNVTMPNKDLIYYAKWNPKVYTVTVNNGDGLTLATENVGYGSTATKPSDPTMEDAVFIGWYYVDAKGDEQRFDFDNMTITQDMTIYAKWRSTKMKEVEIHYVVEDESGVQTQIADTETLMLRLGQARTFEAKTGNSLYEEYRSGCFPTTATHSITPTEADLSSEAPITYTFVYKEYGTVPYQVKFYVEEEDGTKRPAFIATGGKAEFVSSDDYAKMSDAEKLAFAERNSSLTGGAALVEGGQYIELHWENDKAVVTELYVPDALADSTWVLPDNYLPSALKVQKIIVPSTTDPEGNIAANTIEFIYTYTNPVVDPDVPVDPDNPVYEARYLVQHFIQNTSNPDQYDLYSYSDQKGLSGENATATPVSIPGYTYSFEVTNAKKQNGTILTKGTDGADDVMSGTIDVKDSLELNFYYTVNSYPYQVMYLEEGTNRVLKTAKTTDANGNKLTGLYGSKVTENAIEINGYDVVGASTKSIYIQMEAGTSASVNTITFYYARKSADLIVSKTVALDAEQAKEEGITELPADVLAQEFTFTVTCPTGFYKSVYDYTLTTTTGSGSSETTGKITAGTTTMTFTLTSGQSIAIHDLSMGSYTITETYVPGFRTSVDGEIRQAYSVDLVEADQRITAEFLNSYPFYTGDLVIKKNVTKLADTDPTATEPYKVTVVLKPDDAAREVNRVISWTDGDNTEKSYTIPALTGTGDQTEFTIEVLVPVGGEVKLEGVPVGSFTTTEEVKGTVGYIYDYYTVRYNKAVHQNDEVTGTNHVVNGVIHGGHPTAVTFNNTYKKGTLTINKTVTQEYANDSWTSDTFTFSVTGTTELPDGTYKVLIGGVEKTATVASGKVTVENVTITVNKTGSGTSWSNRLTIENLPAGYYTVKESSSTVGLDKYTVVGSAENLLVNNTTTPTEAVVSNTYKRTSGSLKISKTILLVGDEITINTNQPFTFTVQLKDGTLSGNYTCAIKNSDGTAVADSVASLAVNDEGNLSFTLKHDQYIEISGLPVGKYEVAETQVDGYASHFGGAQTASESTTVTVTTDKTTELGCTNQYPVNFGTLTVTKNVITPSDHSAADQAPADDEFTFAVTISGYRSELDLSAGISAKFYGSAEDTTPTVQKLAVTNDVLTFTLKNGERVKLDLPACTYTVAETGLSNKGNSKVLSDHYATAYTVNGTEAVEGTSCTNKLVSGGKEAVVFTNTYKRHYADLTITTKCADQTQSFIFDVSAKNTALGDIHLQVVLVGNDSQTIKDLPVGTYTVTEQDSWSWRENTEPSQTAVLQTASVTVTFDFEDVEKVYWLSGHSYNIQEK